MQHTEAVHGRSNVLSGVRAWEKSRHQRGILTTGYDVDSDDEVYVDSDAYDSDEDAWVCGICDRLFQSPKALWQHANSGVHSDQAYHCKDCDRMFTSAAALYNHVEATSCSHIRHVTKVLAKDYQQQGTLYITDGSRHEATLYFDGASKRNPGDGGAGFVLLDSSGEILEEQSITINEYKCTSNEAEYCGLIFGLMCARDYYIRSLKVYGDSKVVINHMTGEFQVRSQNLRQFYAKASSIAKKFSRIELQWIDRNENTQADRLARLGADNNGCLRDFPV